MKIEAGKRYITRSGDITEEMRPTDNGGAKFFAKPFGLYFEDGTFGVGPNIRCRGLDAVAEYVESDAVTEYIEDDNDDAPGPTSEQAFHRIIAALEGEVTSRLEDGDFDKAIEYAVVMQEVERMINPQPATE